jgi:hypothetical protein
MQITLEIPDDAIAQANLLSDADWLREIAIGLFQQELITLGRGSKIAGMHPIEFQKWRVGKFAFTMMLKNLSKIFSLCAIEVGYDCG